ISAGGRRAPGQCAIHESGMTLCSQRNTDALSFPYRRAYVLEPPQAVYYIGRTSRTTRSGARVHSLYRFETFPERAQSQELAPNITHLVVRYGVSRGRRGGSVVAYLTPRQVTDWSTVSAVGI